MAGEIEAAIASVEAGDDAGALASALAAWRLAKIPELADAIDAISLRLDAKSRRPSKKTVFGRHDEWLAIASKGDPADIPALLATFATEGKQEHLTARLTVLERWAPDPRIALALATLMTRPHLKVNVIWRPFWIRVLKQIRAIGDRRVLNVLPDIRSTVVETSRRGRGWLGVEDVAKVFDEIAATPAPTDDAVERLRAAIAGAHGTKKGSANELFDSVYANPTDDGARQILADVLLELGDPRGEFIALQLSGKRSPKREKELLRDHIATWLGPLAPVVVEKTAVFERGFLERCGVVCKSVRVAKEVVHHDAWATVREISLWTPGRGIGGWDVDVIPLLTSPAMRSLVGVRMIHPMFLPKIKKPLPLKELTLTWFGAEAVPVLASVSELFPALVKLDCGGVNDEHAPWLADLLATAIGARVEALTIDALHDTAKIEWLTTAQRLARSIAAKRVTARRTDPRSGWTWSLSRDASGGLTVLDGAFLHKGYRWLSWHGSSQPLERARGIVTALAPELTAVRLRSSAIVAPEADRMALLDSIRAAAGPAECTFAITDETAHYELDDDG